MAETKYEQVCITVPPSWIRWLERKAKADERTLSSFVRRYLTQHAPDFVRAIEEDQLAQETESSEKKVRN
jgi:hypothetical protein